MLSLLKTLVWRFVPQRLTSKLTFLDSIDPVLANIRYGFPGRKLKIIGITGTDGKTTTCFFLNSILNTWGKKTGLITTVEVRIGEHSHTTGLHVTTPDPWELNRLLSEMVTEQCEYVVLEVTSHAIHQKRILGIPFLIAGLTNITPEHLDVHHGSFESYAATKRSLLSKATQSFESENIADDTLTGVHLSLPGEYNYLNAKLAAAIARSLGVPNDVVKKGLEAVAHIPGRMDVVYEQDFKVIVDFAHTPNGLQAALSSAQKLVPGGGRLISVFGSAGERDQYKRPEMGKIAATIADIVVLTLEDPRSEDVNVIINQIAQGALDAGKHEGEDLFRKPDRTEAIRFAIKTLARPDDVIMITGKGPEQSMNIGGVEYGWDEVGVVKNILARDFSTSSK